MSKGLLATGGIHLLPNGNRLVIVPNEQAGSVGLCIVTDGCRNEPKLLVGHFTEHLIADKGKFPTYQQYARRLDFLARDFNAEISREWMVLFARFLTEDFVPGYRMLSRMILQPSFPRRMPREAQGLVVEKKDGEDKIVDFLHDLTDATVYQGHPLANPMVGAREDVLAVTIDDVQSWHQHLLSQPVTIAVVGQVDPATVVQIVRRDFGTLPRAPIKFGPRFHLRQRRLRVKAVRWPIQLVNVVVAAVTPYGFGHPDRLILSAINNHLGEQDRWASRMGLRLIGGDELRLAYGVMGSVWHHRDCGEWTFRTAVEPEHTEQILRIIAEELQRIKEVPLNKAELGTIKKWLIDGSVQRHNNVVRGATFYGQQLHVTGQHVPHADYVQLVEQQVTAAAIRRVARRVFQRHHLSIVLVGPTHEVRLSTIPRIFSAL